MLPPALLMRSTHSFGTLLDPCITSGKPGSNFWIAWMRSKCSPCLPLNLYAPCEVPIATANESQPLRSTNSTA